MKSFPISTVPVGHCFILGNMRETVFLSLTKLTRRNSRPSVLYDTSKETEQSKARKMILIGEVQKGEKEGNERVETFPRERMIGTRGRQRK